MSPAMTASMTSTGRPSVRPGRKGELGAPRFQATDDVVSALAERAGFALVIAADRRTATLRL